MQANHAGSGEPAQSDISDSLRYGRIELAASARVIAIREQKLRTVLEDMPGLSPYLLARCAIIRHLFARHGASVAAQLAEFDYYRHAQCAGSSAPARLSPGDRHSVAQSFVLLPGFMQSFPDRLDGVSRTTRDFLRTGVDEYLAGPGRIDKLVDEALMQRVFSGSDLGEDPLAQAARDVFPDKHEYCRLRRSEAASFSNLLVSICTILGDAVPGSHPAVQAGLAADLHHARMKEALSTMCALVARRSQEIYG